MSCLPCALVGAWLATGYAVSSARGDDDHQAVAAGWYTFWLLLLLGVFVTWVKKPEVAPGAPEVCSAKDWGTWKAWQRATLFLTAGCLAPMGLAALVAWRFSAEDMLFKLRLYTQPVAAVLSLALWMGGAEAISPLGEQEIAAAPLGTWLPPLYLLGSIGGILHFFSLPLPGVDACPRSVLPEDLRIAWCVLLALWVVSYARIMLATPGFASQLDSTIKAEWETCKKCEQGRRPKQRCRHCSKCGQCVLRFDHHCPWLRRCIGFHNYKFFLAFLVNSVLLLDLSLGASVGFLVEQLGEDWPFWSRLTMVSATSLIAFLTALLNMFCAFHIYLSSKNKTTLEFMLGARLSPLSFDQGSVFANIRAVLGNPLLWCLPFGGPEGTGADFPCKLIQPQLTAAAQAPLAKAAAVPQATDASKTEKANLLVPFEEELVDSAPREARTVAGIHEDLEDMEDGACPCIDKHGPTHRLYKSGSKELGSKMMKNLTQGLEEILDEEARVPRGSPA